MSAPELVAGSVVGGKYTIRSLLSQGGATASYRAMAAKNREVALKLYDPQILSFPDVLKALALHQSLGAKLPPNQIIPIAESGTDPNSGAPFTVTGFESAPSLARLIDRGPLSASQMVALVRNLAKTTDLLHSSGIVGISLHPGNVFVRPGPPCEARLMDFGATLVRSALPVPEKAGRWMPWLAPEQIKAQAPAAQAADIFALALVAFFAVTGRPYWRSSQVKTPDTAALRREILGERMPASVRAGEFSIVLNPAVDAVFARALAFRPADRYATARELAAGLEAALSGRSASDAGTAESQAPKVASATVNAGAAGPANHRGSSPGEAALVAGRMAAPPARKMPLRTTMLGMGNAAAAVAAGPLPDGARPPMATIAGVGEPTVEMPIAPARAAVPSKAVVPAKPAAPPIATPPAKPAAPPIATPPAKPAAPAMATPPAKPAAPPMAVATAVAAPLKPAPTAMSPASAMIAEPPMVVPARRGGPPPLPMAAPPAQMEPVPARFEARPPDPLPERAAPPSPVMDADVVRAAPAWRMSEHTDAGVEGVQTGVAVIGANRADTPKNSRLRWAASISAVLALTGGATWALSSGGTSASRGRAGSDAHPAPPLSAELPGAKVQPAANAGQGEQETPTPTAREPAAPAPRVPAVQEPEPEPAVAVADTKASAPPAIVPGSSTPNPTLAPRTAPSPPHPQPSQKPCGKFLKRCK